MVFDLTNREKCLAFMGIALSSTKNDDRLALFIPAISDEIIRWLNYDPVIKLRTEYFDVTNYRAQFTSENEGLKKISEVVNDPERLYDTTPILATDYTLYPHGEILFDRVGLSQGFRSLRVKHYAGITLEESDYVDILSDPPVAPATGSVYIVGAIATGAWAGQDEKVATWDGATWAFTDQQVNFLVNNPALSLAVTTQVVYTLQTVDKLGANYTALQSHVKTYSPIDTYLPQVLRALHMFKRTIFTKS